MSYCRLLLTPRMTLLIVIGSLIYSVGLNQFIVPVGLYNGGFLGIAQLIRHFMESWFGISFGNTNIAGILYFILNIPLLAVSVKRFGKEFLAETLQTLKFECFCISKSPKISSPPPLPPESKVIPAPIPQITPPATQAVKCSSTSK